MNHGAQLRSASIPDGFREPQRRSLLGPNIRLAVIAVALSFMPDSRAEGVWLTSGLFSKHLTHDSDYYRENGHYRENHIGGGVEIGNFYAGTFKNSIDKRSRYLTYAWRPLRYGYLRAGVAAGVLDGYTVNNGGFFPVAIPHVSAEYKRFGANVILIPKFKDVDALIAVQFKVRLDGIDR